MNSKFAVFALILTLTFYPIATYAQDAECVASADHMADGEGFLAAGEYVAAHASFSCAIDGDPDPVQAYGALIRTDLVRGNYSDAFNDFLRLRVHAGTNQSAAMAQLIGEARNASEASPDDPSFHMLRGFLNFLGTTSFARSSFERILELDPDNLYATVFRGAAAQFLDDPEAAAEDFARAEALDPDNPQVYFVIGLAYGETGEFEKAIDAIDRAVELGLEDPSAYVIRADAYAGIGDMASAAPDYARHVELALDEILEGPVIEPEEPVTVEVGAGQGVQLTFEGEAGQIVRILVEVEPFDGDGFTVLTGPDGAPVAGNDDGPGSLNPELTAVELAEDGTYSLVVTTYLGLAGGEITVTLTEPE